MVTIKYRHIVIAAYIIILFPLVIFAASWVKLFIGIPAAILLIGGAVYNYKVDYAKQDRALKLSLGHLIGVFAFFGFFILFSGTCIFGVAEYDIHCRNAILRDLINYDWPVIYDNGNALVYYLTFWLPSALLGKLFGWHGGCIGLWIHITLIICVAYLLILALMKKTTPARMWMVALLMILFSGLSVAGILIVDTFTYTEHSDLWTGTGYLDSQYTIAQNYMWHYRCNSEMIRYVYNQLPYWLIVPLMLGNRKTHSLLYLGMCMLPYSPWCFIGCIPLLIAAAAGDMRATAKAKGVLRVVRDIFSPSGIIGLVVISVIFGAFFLSSATIGASSSDAAAAATTSASSGMAGFIDFSKFGLKQLCFLILFYMLEFGIYSLLIGKYHLKDPLFWTIIVWLLLCPLLWVGGGQTRDFTMNASLPAIMVMLIYILQHLDEHVLGKPLTLMRLLLIIAILIGAACPVQWTFLNIAQLVGQRTIHITAENVGSFSEQDPVSAANFLNSAPDQTLFYKYLAR